MNDAVMSFANAVDRIATEYARLGYDLGWRFLYSPKATLGPETDIAFFGVNPGGNVSEPPVASVEQGNAYRTECWPGNGASLQREVKKLFQLLAVELGRSGDWEAIMDATLTSNFCPFRSPSWAALPKRDDAVRFSVDLWGQLWGSLRPRVVICNGSGTLALMVPVLEHAGYTMAAVESLPSGWGHYSFAVKSYLHETRGGMLVVELPHLSRFRVMTRPGCHSAVQALVAKLAGALAAPRLRAPAVAASPNPSASSPDRGAPAAVQPPVSQAPSTKQKAYKPMTNAAKHEFWQRFLGKYGARLPEYEVKSTGDYLFRPWKDGIHLSFGILRNGASVRFNLKAGGPGTLSQHEEEVHKRLESAGIAYKSGVSKTGQTTYGSFSVVPDTRYELPEQEDALFDWMFQCWQVFEAYRRHLRS